MNKDAMIAALIFGGSGGGSGLPDASVDGHIPMAFDGGWVSAPQVMVISLTITGQPVNNVYPISATFDPPDDPLDSIADYYPLGIRIVARVDMGNGEKFEMPLVTYVENEDHEPQYAGFVLNGAINGAPVMGIATILPSGSQSTLRVIPLSTAQMTYDSGTGTLAITE